MGWLKKKIIKETQWQFYVIDDKGQGYRINIICQPLWTTPIGTNKYFLGTPDEATLKVKDLLEDWKNIFGVYPKNIFAQEYINIPD